MNATNAPNSPQNSANLQAEQKAHEPSMEDILASIRRIIADDDALPLSRRAAPVNPPPAIAAPQVVTPQSSTLQASPPPPAIPPLRAEPAGPALKSHLSMPLPTPLPVDNPFALRFAPLPLPPAIPVAPQPIAAPEIELRPSLDEAQDESPLDDRFEPPSEARVAPAPAAAEPPPQVRFDDAGLQAAQLAFRASFSAPPIHVALKAAPSVVNLQVSSPQVLLPQASAPELSAPAVQAVTPDLHSPQATAQVVEPVVHPAQPVAFEPQSSPPRSIGLPPARIDRPEPSLMSEISGVKVGAAFEALAESALLRDPEMVERLTREILRPIIKDWLDDNLPNVVERLVRAEIERVARGPKG